MIKNKNDDGDETCYECVINIQVQTKTPIEHAWPQSLIWADQQ